MKICGVITAASAREAANLCQMHAARLDAIEFRLDYLEAHQSGELLAMIRRIEKPIIATLRPERHGGRYKGSEAARLEILAEFAESGAAYVDLEDDVPEHELAFFGARVKTILSYHNFDSTPPELQEIAGNLAKRPANALKIAVRNRSLDDLCRLLQVRNQLRGDPREKILIGMDAPGLLTRILGTRMNSTMSYAAISESGRSAPGQLTLSDLLGMYNVRAINETTEAYGVLGWPVEHSLSPQIHNASFAARGMNRVYVPLATPSLTGLQDVVQQFRFRGLSVTIPHKQAILPLCDELDETARSAGAVNTVTIREGYWLGSNTDVEGFLLPLRSRIALAGIQAAVIGSGGAARAVCRGLAEQGARFVIFSRNRTEGQAIAEFFHASWEPLGNFGREPVDLVIQATSAGMSPHEEEVPCDLRVLEKTNRNRSCLVYDLIYRPRMTRFLAEARRSGFQTLDGLEMLLAQAALQFRLWTGEDMPMETARGAALNGFEAGH